MTASLIANGEPSIPRASADSAAPAAPSPGGLNVLWLPHTSMAAEGWEGCRQYHLIRRMVAAGHRLSWISWTQSKRLRDVLGWGRVTCEATAFGDVYTIGLAPNFYRLITRKNPRPYHIALNQALFRRAIRDIYRRVGPDVLVYSSSCHFTGFPPFDFPAPMVFDYVDQSDARVEDRYIRPAACVVAVSPELAEIGHAYGKPVALIPNGVDADRYARLSRQEAKARLGLGERPVVSLIGLTCSHELYFIDAIANLQRDLPNLALVIVGGGKTREAIVAKAERCGLKNLHAPGPIPHAQVPIYFRATDVGLYPGEDTRYYREASPLKIIEYVAAGARVVSSPVNLFKVGWPGVALTQPNAKTFEAAIRSALDAPAIEGGGGLLNNYDWAVLADRFDQCLRHAVAGDEAGCTERKL